MRTSEINSDPHPLYAEWLNSFSLRHSTRPLTLTQTDFRELLETGVYQRMTSLAKMADGPAFQRLMDIAEITYQLHADPIAAKRALARMRDERGEI